MKKLISITGSPNSGKTVTAIKLAIALAAQHQNVVVVWADGELPPASFLLPQNKNHEYSLGSVLASDLIKEQSVLAACFTFKNNPYLCFLGYKEKETAHLYPTVSEESVTDMLIYLKQTADYIIVDGTSSLQKDTITRVSARTSDVLIQQITADTRGIAWHQCNQTWIKNNIQAKQITVFGNSQNNDISIVENIVGGQSKPYVLPKDVVVKLQYNEQRIQEPIKDENNSFVKVFNSIVEEILDIQIKTIPKQSFFKKLVSKK